MDAATGEPLRAIPPDSVAGPRGLKDFLTLRVLDGRGRTAIRRTIAFCPGATDGTERFHDQGPALPGFFSSCSRGFPFTLGMVWGLSNGWASPVGFRGSHVGFIPRRVLVNLPRRVRERLRRAARRGPKPFRLRPGSYRAVARINEPYRSLFGIPAEHAEATVRIRVVRPQRRRRPGSREAARRANAAKPHAAQTVEQPAPDTVPDLVALPPWDLSANRGRGRRRGRDYVRFAGSPWNAGPAPLVVEGFRSPGEDFMRAYQYFFDADGEVVGRAPAGAMAFHDAPRHNHWHFLQLVTYRLVRSGGRPAVRSRKQAFCITATDPVDLTLPRAQADFGLTGVGGSACGMERSIWIREALPAGWADTYGAGTPGQSFDITRVPNGRYVVEMEVNPGDELYEVSKDNNVARRRITLSGRRGARRVRAAPWNGIDR